MPIPDSYHEERSPGPGPAKKCDWKAIADKWLKGKLFRRVPVSATIGAFYASNLPIALDLGLEEPAQEGGSQTQELREGQPLTPQFLGV